MIDASQVPGFFGASETRLSLVILYGLVPARYARPRMSALGGKADVNGELPQCPLLTRIGHWTCYLRTTRSFASTCQRAYGPGPKYDDGDGQSLSNSVDNVITSKDAVSGWGRFN
jgi:hypothetical protein